MGIVLVSGHSSRSYVSIEGCKNPNNLGEDIYAHSQLGSEARKPWMEISGRADWNRDPE
jgi:hypothetical protein